MKLAKYLIIAAIVLVVFGVFGVFSIPRVELGMAFKLVGQDHHLDGAVLEVEGYAIKFPFGFHYVNGSATIDDTHWDIENLRYSYKDSRFVMRLFEWTPTTHHTARLYFDSYQENEEEGLLDTAWGIIRAIPKD